MERLMKSKAGFTLIELIIVIIILGVLAAVATPAVFSWVANSRVNTIKNDIATVESAAKQLYAKDPATFLQKAQMDAITKTSKAVWAIAPGDNASGTSISTYIQSNSLSKKLSEMNLAITAFDRTSTSGTYGQITLEVALPPAKVVGNDFSAAPGYTITNQDATSPGQVEYKFFVN